jgi:HEAT repeat protein
VSFLRESLRPIAGIDSRQVDRLVADLDNDSFAVRDRATRELEQLGELAEPALRKGLESRPPPEVRRRMVSLLEKLEGTVTSPDWLRALRAVEALEQMGTAEAGEVLQQLVRGAPEARLTQEARASLQRLARRTAAQP